MNKKPKKNFPNNKPNSKLKDINNINKNLNNNETIQKNNSTKKPDPTKYGDWSINGRTIDF